MVKSTGKSLIILKYRYNKQKLVFTFNQSVEPANWNPKKQRIKSNAYTTSDGRFYLNELLDNLEQVCTSTYNREIGNGIPTISVIRGALKDFLNHNTDAAEKKASVPTLFQLIDRFINQEIGKKKAPGTIKAYQTSKACLKDFEKSQKMPLNYEDVNLDFFYKYVAHMKTKNLKTNTIAKRVRTIKVFMGEAVDLGYTTNLQWKNRKFSVTEVEVDSVYLTESEIITLYNHDFSQNLKLQSATHLFALQCFTGLRYSDLHEVNPSNIINHEGESFLRIKTSKTQAVVFLPIHTVVLEIFEKYKTKPLKKISNQKLNKYIKEACHEAGLVERGRLQSEPDKQLWECVTTHTGRRSAVTNLYLQNCPIVELMNLTGHKTQTSFMKYLKMTKLQSAKRLQTHIKANFNVNLLKAI